MSGLCMHYRLTEDGPERVYPDDAIAFIAKVPGDRVQLPTGASAIVTCLHRTVPRLSPEGVEKGIRGTRAQWDAKVREECADVFIKLCDIAQYDGFDLADAIAERWTVVKQRDWRADPIGHGIGGEG